MNATEFLVRYISLTLGSDEGWHSRLTCAAVVAVSEEQPPDEPLLWRTAGSAMSDEVNAAIDDMDCDSQLKMLFVSLCDFSDQRQWAQIAESLMGTYEEVREEAELS